jgi:hypothetical protein
MRPAADGRALSDASYHTAEIMRAITFRVVFESSVIFGLLDETEFASNLTLMAARDVKPVSEHFLGVFVLSVEPLGDGTLRLTVLSTTVLGVQRYTTTRLRHQGVHIMVALNMPEWVLETLRAHYRGVDQDVNERLRSMWSGLELRWTKDFPSGAGDLEAPPQFIFDDPDVQALKDLFSKPDPRSE